MAGCSPTADGSSSPSLDVLEILRRLQSVGFCLDHDADAPWRSEARHHKLGALFERVVSVFYDEISHRREIRPLPAVLGDGRPVDLFRLYRVVREKGRYGAVTKARSWDSVAAGVGLDPAVGSAVKLIYKKYLDEVDRWLQKVFVKEAGGVGCKEEIPPCEIPDVKVDGCELMTPSGSKREQLWTPTRGNSKIKQQVNVENGIENGNEHGCDDDVVVLEPDAWCSEASSLKRKRKVLFGLLKWVRKVAKSPGDPSMKKVSHERCKDRDLGFNEAFSQVLLARDAMFLKRIRYPSSNGSLSEKRPKLHNFIYENYIDVDPQTNERPRCSQRILSLNKQSQPCSCSETSRIPADDSDKGLMGFWLKANPDKRLNDLTLSLISGVSSQDLKPIPVGPSHQARVPEWIGLSSVTSNDSDYLKWLGTRIWPPEAKEKNILTERDPIGKGRQDTCGCEHRGSVECVRFHVAEKRLQLKCELGSAFHSWRFDHMGEEVALSWTEEEEWKFKDVVRLNPPSLNKNFLEQAYLCFPSKRKQSIVSYYFNVFLLRRRSYQNRVTPNDIDSDDDDESEFGFLSNAFGHDAVKVQNSKAIFCAQNAQCMNLDD